MTKIEMIKHLVGKLKLKKMPNAEELYDFLLGMCKPIRMKPLGLPIIVKGAPHLPGLTGFLIIETSHIAAHTFTDTMELHFAIYSCKDFRKDKLIEYILNNLDVDSMKTKNIEFW